MELETTATNQKHIHEQNEEQIKMDKSLLPFFAASFNFLSHI
jgi:hypothetical protein